MNADHTNLTLKMHKANMFYVKSENQAQCSISYEINRIFTLAQVEQPVNIT